MTFTNSVKRTSPLLVAAAFTLALLASVVALVPAKANAYGVAAERYIKMSSSANGTVGGATTTYEVRFETGTLSNLEGVVVDICASDPLIGEACTLPTNFSFASATVTTTGGVNTGLGAGWTAAAINSNRTLTLKNSSGPAAVAAGTEIIFTINLVRNPDTTNSTFYGRILTFAVDSDIDTWDNAADGSSVTGVVDAGGVALSTAAQLALTAKVQETLTFCVWITTNCAGGGTAVDLGDGNGVLASTTTHYTDTANFDLASNASLGAVVRLKGGILTSGGNNITASLTDACIADDNTATVEQFGLRLSTTGSGQTADPTYACSAGNHAWHSTETASTYGSPIASTAAGTASSTSTIEYTAKAATTTEAGIYTATHTLIATAQY